MIKISDEVRDALAAGRPVLALESTIITHGLPRPRNLDVAVEAETRLRAAGVTPATIGVVAGVPVVGLSTDELEQLSLDDGAAKLSVRDLPVAAAKKLNGGTTVAATALLAHRAGVRVFSTGGLGGVHEGAGVTFDESADLFTLAETPIVVVSAGAKSILDIAATLERLETLSIPVVGYRTTTYPGFYIVDSGHSVEYAADSPEEIAAMAASQRDLGLKSALLVANPVPADKQLAKDEHDAVIEQARAAARDQGIIGHDTTPFLLDHLLKATEGRSLETNVAIYNNNVDLGGRIAAALAAR
ncbi:pseudouridine-5'-phosphate glycosidase [Actinoplanes sp. LDG1-06]|uniref:Pseudouridine-5'-phosphate glycosidase n=1 Tax=Paractinoplanes ovalisporus TaxID=2810368 RepID=A0ABS2AK79_9ACTN|nr:pseudouridine-5'-phosphate glycosidase [Actinoplanes ovalisporus]MBM2619641.1 pseudouridine-5'-phosphate glycosidase [Actinoplanes ovalisporus]